MSHFDKIVASIDSYMERNKLKTVTPPEANEHLALQGLLPNYDRSGSQLRRLCRMGYIRTARQPGGKGTKWVIYHSSDKSFSISSRLQNIIDSGKGEREICAFLAKHPEILRWSVCKTGGHGTWVIKEFPLGSKYKVDFAVVTCYSGKWDIHLIELEPHDDDVITKKGTPSARLSGAISQINDWKEYIEQNQVEFRRVLSEWCVKKDILGVSKKIKIPVNGTGQYLKSSDTYLDIDYYIVIGNRAKVNEEQRRRMNQLQRFGLDIFTYNRFVDVAANFDKYHHGYDNVMLTETKE